MGVKVIHNLPYLDRSRTAFIDRLLNPHCPILSGTIFSFCMSFVCRSLSAPEYLRYPVSNVFAVNTFRLSRCAKYWLANFADHLFARNISIMNQKI